MGPFIKDKDTKNKISIRLLISLIPIIIYMIYNNGISSLIFISISILFTFIFELLYSNIFKDSNYMKETYSLIPGILLSIIIPTSVPIYGLIIGLFIMSVSKIILNKFNKNIFNPVILSYFVISILFSHNFENQINSILCVVLCFISFLYLFITKTIKWRITVTYIATVFLINYVIGSSFEQSLYYPLFHIINGNLLLASIYLATDSYTSTVTPIGQIFQGLFLGIITVLFSYIGIEMILSILVLNMFIPLLDNIGFKSRFNIKNAVGPFLIAWISIILICLYFSNFWNIDSIKVVTFDELKTNYIYKS